MAFRRHGLVLVFRHARARDRPGSSWFAGTRRSLHVSATHRRVHRRHVDGKPLDRGSANAWRPADGGDHCRRCGDRSYAWLRRGCTRASEYWRTDLSLWEHALDVDPGNYRAHAVVGMLLRDRPDRKADAISHLSESLRLQPDQRLLHSTLADLLFEERRLPEAIAHLRAAVDLDPSSASAHMRLAKALSFNGQRAEAIAEASTAVKLDPSSTQYRADLAAIVAGGK